VAWRLSASLDVDDETDLCRRSDVPEPGVGQGHLGIRQFLFKLLLHALDARH